MPWEIVKKLEIGKKIMKESKNMIKIESYFESGNMDEYYIEDE
jgi:hypothetical protein